MACACPALRAALAPLALVLALLLAGPAAAGSMFYIRGGGDGHGIGMSQYGAYGYAQHGKSYKFILAHYYQGTTLGSANARRTVRVLLRTGASQFSGANRAGGKRIKPGSTYSVRPNADGSLTLLDPRGKQVGHFAAPLTVTGTGPLSLGGALYRGALEFRAASSGVQTIEAVDLEDYVRGVISAEVPASWSAEALKAQAVAARTYAITTNVGGGAYDVYPDTRSQMYRGVAAETPTTDAAVAATRGQVVTYGGHPVVTYFFNSSGGHTENIGDVWTGATPRPWLRGVPDPYDGAGGDPYHRWGYDMSVAGAAAKLGGLIKGALVGIQVTKHGSSPRILTASVVGTQGSTSASGAELQRAFGLLTTYASFTTISADPGANPPQSAAMVKRAPAVTRAVTALVPLVNNMVAASVPGMHGNVFPVTRGATIAIQVSQRRAWHTVERMAVSASGAYGLQLPGPGSYRVVYRGVNGPVVSVS